MSTLIKHIDYYSLLVGRKGSQCLAWKIFLIFKNYIQTMINILTIDFLLNIFKEKKCNAMVKISSFPPFNSKVKSLIIFSIFHFFHLWTKWIKKNITPGQLLQANCPWETTSLGRRRFEIFNQIAREEKDLEVPTNNLPTS